MKKRGAIEVQFNWIFVLIAGAVILILIIGNVQRQKNISKYSIDILTLNSLDAVLSGFEASTGSINVLEIPNSKIEFGCNKATIVGVSKQFNAMNVFTPSVLEGNNIISVNNEWKIPYKATNLIYLTNPNIKYIFIGNSDFARELYVMMPDEINSDGYTQVQAIQDENYDSVRIIFFNQEPEIPDSFKAAKKSVTALKVNGNENKGDIEFFELVDNEFESKGTSHYLRQATLFGAVFTDDIEVYECVMESAFKDLKAVSQVYKKKIDGLREYYIEKNDACQGNYSVSHVQEILDATETFNQLNINQIDSAAENLELQNKDTQKYSCVSIY